VLVCALVARWLRAGPSVCVSVVSRKVECNTVQCVECVRL